MTQGMPEVTVDKQVVVLVEDHNEIAHLTIAALTDAYHVRHVEPHVALMPETWSDVDIAIVDLQLRTDVTGQDILRFVADRFPNVHRIISTAMPFISEEVKALAHAVLPKPHNIDDLTEVLNRGR